MRRMIGSGHYAAASEECLRMMDRYPHDAILHETFVEINLYAGTLDGAETTLRRRLAAGSSVEQCFYGIGLTRYHRRLYRDALDAFARSIRYGNESPDCYKYLAYTIDRLCGPEEAIRRLSLMSHEESYKAQGWYALALSHWTKGNNIEAQRAIDEALARDPYEPAYRRMGTIVSLRMGNTKNPERCLLSLIKEAEKSADISASQFLRWYVLQIRSSRGDEVAWHSMMKTAMKEAEEYGAIHWLGWLHEALAMNSLHHGDLDGAIASSQVAIEASKLTEDEDLKKGATRIQLDAFQSSGKYAKALQIIAATMTDTSEFSQNIAQVETLNDAGLLLNNLHRSDMALNLIVEAMNRLRRSQSDPRFNLREESILGVVFESLADTLSALRIFGEALKQAKAIGDSTREVSIAYGNLARQYIEMQNYKLAESLLVRQLNLAISSRFHTEEASALTNLGELAVREKNFVKASYLFGLSQAIAKANGMLPIEYAAAFGSGVAHLGLKDVEGSYFAFNSAAAIIDSLNSNLPPFVWGNRTRNLEVFRRLIDLSIKQGKPDVAMEWFEKTRSAVAEGVQSFSSLVRTT
ncbi:MAG: tetratricopeptide repeat protein, partial [Bacteroidota bacterium]